MDIEGYIVEKLSGQSLPDFIMDHIYKPLGMRDADFYVPANKRSRFAAVYTTGKNGELVQAAADPAHALLVQELEEVLRKERAKVVAAARVAPVPPKEPRSAIYVAMLFNEYPDEIRATGPLNGVSRHSRSSDASSAQRSAGATSQLASEARNS